MRGMEERLGIPSRSNERNKAVETALSAPQAQRILGVLKFMTLPLEPPGQIALRMAQNPDWLRDGIAYQLDEFLEGEGSEADSTEVLVAVRRLLFRGRIDAALGRPLLIDMLSPKFKELGAITETDAVAHVRKILERVSQEAEPTLWLLSILDLAGYLLGIVGPGRPAAIEESMVLHREAVKFLDRLQLHRDAAKARIDLAIAYRNRLLGDAAENIDAAVTCLQESERVLTRERYPIDWALLSRVLGDCLTNRCHRDRADDVGEARGRLQDAMDVLDPKLYPSQWARAAVSFAPACMFERRQPLHKMAALAITTLNKALEIVPTGRDDLVYGVHDQLASVHAHLAATGIQAKENRKAALKHCRSALPIAERQGNRGALAEIYFSTGIALADDNPSEAIGWLEKARNLFKGWNPVRWAAVTLQLALIPPKGELATGGDGIARLERIAREALEVYSEDAFPVQNCLVHMALGHRHFAASDWQRAKEEYTRAVAVSRALFDRGVWEEGRQLHSRDATDAHERLAFCLVKLGKPLDAVAHFVDRERPDRR
jgi:tetratricopeptide (TPR) repeat protein